ncbi:DUF3331 domain-containing protein [Paraburkholderia sp. GAS334]|uniref:DUF3331 domain-containing protein n=1 Tax=Paraburkholderia sp. GAS334 TaxID=3035131 RepID=UPI003D2517E9
MAGPDRLQLLTSCLRKNGYKAERDMCWSGTPIKRGNAVYRPRRTSDTPVNASAMILAIYLDSPQLAPRRTPPGCFLALGHRTIGKSGSYRPRGCFARRGLDRHATRTPIVFRGTQPRKLA